MTESVRPQMDDDELVEKMALVLCPEPCDPSTPTEREMWKSFSFPQALRAARAALQVVKDAGWTPQIKVRQVTRPGPDFSDAE